MVKALGAAGACGDSRPWPMRHAFLGGKRYGKKLSVKLEGTSLKSEESKEALE